MHGTCIFSLWGLTNIDLLYNTDLYLNNNSSDLPDLGNSEKVLESRSIAGATSSIFVSREPGPEWGWVSLSLEWSEGQLSIHLSVVI